MDGIVFLGPDLKPLAQEEGGMPFRVIVTGSAIGYEPVSPPPPPPPPSLGDIKSARVSELNAACNAAILAGFSSSALGETHTYDFDMEAQANLTGMLAVMNADDSMNGTVWKTTDAGPLPHNRQQFIALCRDGLNHKNDLIARYWTLKAQVELAETEEEVNAIVWETPTTT
ncbi:DUF4376 domain-containing protein [Tumebacillus flagellatus]|uniref:DUF4376 domain-containing protein n=1 Tax=Tumebacillus flagellatus TaxID=1157490 RepID=A0A074LUX7_9BACL|nr:DUF4376 domain-containing protein [Tumebacillus flagellatus]KEO84744.1 hypothetical protein EL26_01675 [Tumebacillus flagellatus]